MICRDKTTSPEQWIDFVAGSADVAERERLELHLAGCARCREIHLRLLSGRDALQHSVPREAMTHAAVSRIWNNLAFRIRRLVGTEEHADPAALQQLRAILVSMCGEAAADGALHKANTGSQFPTNLGCIVEVMCGTRAALLVRQAAESVRREKVA